MHQLKPQQILFELGLVLKDLYLTTLLNIELSFNENLLVCSDLIWFSLI